MEEILMNFIGLLLVIFLAVMGLKYFLPKKFRGNRFFPDKFILEDILKWKEFLNLFKVSIIRKRFLMSLAFLIVPVLGGCILIPGIDAKELNFLVGKCSMLYFMGRRMGIFALGIMPFISANTLLLLFGIALPSVRRYSQSVNGDKCITHLIYLFTIALCIFQGRGVASWLQNPNTFTGTAIVPSPGLGFTIMTIVFLTFGTAVLLMLGYRITQYGIGHGISLIMVVFVGITFVSQVFRSLIKIIKISSFSNEFIEIIAALFLFIISLLFAFWLLRIKRPITFENTENGAKTTAYLSINQAGIIPILLAQSIILLPMALIRFCANSSFLSKLGNFLRYGGIGYYISFLILTIIFSRLCGKAIVNPKHILKRMRQLGLSIISENKEDGKEVFFYRLYNRLNFIWAGVLVLYFIVLDILKDIFHLPYLMSGWNILLIAAVILGILHKIKRNYNFKEIYTHPESGEVLVVKSYLETRGLKVFLDNEEAVGRLYGYFIGPLARKKILVSSEDYPIALELVGEYKGKIKEKK